MSKHTRIIAVLTSGGDSPGMNACVRAVTRAAVFHGTKVYGIRDGFRGLVDGSFQELDSDSVSDIISRGGTFLGSSRCERFRSEEGRIQAKAQLDKYGVDSLVVIGGDGSFAGAMALHREHGVSVVGIPGTIDNDLPGTDLTIGFDSAVNVVVESVDRIRDTATSHHRMFFVEVMGRDSGRIAMDAGICCGAEAVLLPEERNEFLDFLEKIDPSNRPSRPFLIIVAEGDEEGGAEKVAKVASEKLPEFDIRVTVLGHLQRGGNPTAQDRKLASLMGVLAVDTLILGENSDNPQMIVWRAGNVGVAPLSEAFQQKESSVTEDFRVAKILANT